MALEFERNTNLEEIDSDALFGITYLAHQTIGQKVIFFGCVITSTLIFIGSQFIFDVPFLAALVIEIIFGTIGFLFGANQCEYLSIAQYLKLLFFKPIKYAKFASSEDIGLMKKSIEQEKLEAERRQKEMTEATAEGQRRMLVMVIAIIVGVIVFTGIIFAIKSYRADKPTHHTISYVIDDDNLEI
ncbi:MAG: hypothetical protein K5769_07120 [Pseudobutyrivibrio sp.]|nr:hypothetical protein [Pseudobutyrivibrio sp.]